MSSTTVAGVERTATHRACPECDGALEGDTDRAEAVCSQCGLVVSEEEIDYGPEWRCFRDDDTDPRRCCPANQNRRDGGLGSTPPRFDPDGVERAPEIAHRNQLARSGFERKDRNRDYATSEIARLCSVLELPDTVTRQAQQAFCAWHEAADLFGRNLDRLAAAAVLYAARASSAGVTGEDVETVARHDDANEIRSAMHTLGDEVGVRVAPPTARARLTRLIGETSLDVPEQVRTDALEMLEDHGSSRSPTALAAAALYLAAGGRGRHGYGRWTQLELAQACDICPATLRHAAHVLVPGYGGEQA